MEEYGYVRCFKRGPERGTAAIALCERSVPAKNINDKQSARILNGRSIKSC